MAEDFKKIKEGEREIEKLDTRMRKKAHKLMGNYLMRYYSDNTEMRFKHWKMYTQNQRTKQRLV